MFKRIILLLSLLAVQLWSAPVDQGKARVVAENWLKFNSHRSDANIRASYTARVDGENVYYGYNFSNGGFVLVAANDAALPVLAYSPVSELDPHVADITKLANPGVQHWLRSYQQQISSINASKAENSENKAMWQQILNNDFSFYSAKNSKEVLPLVTTTWNQRYPYNMYCPLDNGVPSVVGCVATALVQILRYHQYPLHGQGSHSHYVLGQNLTVNYAAQTYNWSNMPNSGLDQDFYKQQEIAKISYHAGVAVDMNYSATGSGAQTSILPDILTTYFKYSSDADFVYRDSYTDTQWAALLKSELDLERPMEYSGYGDAGGHAFVCDGYQNETYFHFNWGWEGKYDGFFQINNLNPGTYTFNDNQGVAYKIHPAETILTTAPTALVLNHTATTANLQWDYAELTGTSFKVYRNDSLITTVNTKNFTDNNVGSANFYTYFVTAVKNSQESKPSNTVVIDQQAPTVLTVKGNVALVGQSMQLTLKLDDLSAITEVIAITEINGATVEIPMNPANKHAQSFIASVVAQSACVQGTVKFKMKDAGGYQLLSAAYPLYWFYTTTLTDDFSNGNFALLNWQFEGSANWMIDPNNGNKCIKSGSIGNDQITAVKTTQIFPVDGSVTFKKKVSSEDGYDKLRFYLDGVKKAEWSGEAAWSEETFPVTAGEHLLKWSYEKDGYSVDGSDCAWLDDIVLTGVATTTTAIEPEGGIINSVLSQNYPNPFNPATRITFTLAAKAQTRLSVYNAKGELIRTLVNGMQNSGMHSVDFDGTGLNSGIYFYKLETNGQCMINKMVFCK